MNQRTIQHNKYILEQLCLFFFQQVSHLYISEYFFSSPTHYLQRACAPVSIFKVLLFQLPQRLSVGSLVPFLVGSTTPFVAGNDWCGRGRSSLCSDCASVDSSGGGRGGACPIVSGGGGPVLGSLDGNGSHGDSLVGPLEREKTNMLLAL